MATPATHAHQHPCTGCTTPWGLQSFLGAPLLPAASPRRSVGPVSGRAASRRRRRLVSTVGPASRGACACGYGSHLLMGVLDCAALKRRVYIAFSCPLAVIFHPGQACAGTDVAPAALTRLLHRFTVHSCKIRECPWIRSSWGGPLTTRRPGLTYWTLRRTMCGCGTRRQVAWPVLEEMHLAWPR